MGLFLRAALFTSLLIKKTCLGFSRNSAAYTQQRKATNWWTIQTLVIHSAATVASLTQLHLRVERRGGNLAFCFNRGEKKNKRADMRNLLIPLHCPAQSFCYTLLPNQLWCAFSQGFALSFTPLVDFQRK